MILALERTSAVDPEPPNGLQRSIGRIEGSIVAIDETLRELRDSLHLVDRRMDTFDRHLTHQDHEIQLLQNWQQRHDSAETARAVMATERQKRILTRRDGILIVVVSGLWTAVLEMVARAGDIARALRIIH